jgi:hypothetical protein
VEAEGVKTHETITIKAADPNHVRVWRRTVTTKIEYLNTASNWIEVRDAGPLPKNSLIPWEPTDEF